MAEPGMELDEGGGTVVTEPKAAEPAVDDTKSVSDDTKADEDLSDLSADVVETAGRKLVPAGVVAHERKAKREALERAKALEADIEKLKQWQDYGTQAASVLEKLPPDVVQAILAGEDISGRFSGRQGANEEPADAKLVELAKTLDLVDASGKPDLERAKVVQGLVTEAATAAAGEQVRPIIETTDAERSAANLRAAIASEGIHKPQAETLAAFWRTMPANVTADPGVAEVLKLAALGYDVSKGRVKAAAPRAPDREPLHIETSGGGTRILSLNDRQRGDAKAAGRSEREYAQDIVTGIEAGGRLE